MLARRYPEVGFAPAFTGVAPDDLRAYLEEVERWIHRAENRRQPVSKGQLLDTLVAFAEMLGVSPPGDAGLDLYLAALEDFPHVLLEPAKVAVAKRHRFARLPTPADFINAVADERERLDGELHFLVTLKTQLLNAIHRHEEHERRYPS